jgi:hypothetical protein
VKIDWSKAGSTLGGRAGSVKFTELGLGDLVKNKEGLWESVNDARFTFDPADPDDKQLIALIEASLSKKKK